MIYNGPKITTFREVFDWIMYDWDNHYELTKAKDGTFNVNKLYIGPNFLQYKTECYEIDKNLYNKVNQLYEIMK